MRKTFAMTLSALAVFVAAGFLADRATAEPLQGTYNRDQIASACGSAGGRYYSNLDGYGCFKENCDGKGGLCGVVCQNNGKCDGSTPQAKVARGQAFKNLNAVLGSAVVLQPAKSGSKSVPPGGLLDSRAGMGPSAPSATGTPSAPPPPPVQKIN